MIIQSSTSPQTPKTMRVLSIDPGYDRCGVAVIDEQGAKNHLVFSTCIQTDKKNEYIDRLKEVVSTVEGYIADYKPDMVGIEQVFITNNQKTATKISEVRGALLFVCAKAAIRVFEFSPSQIKLAVAGTGSATKDEVTKMVSLILKTDNSKKLDDEFDALACGIACLSLYKRMSL